MTASTFLLAPDSFKGTFTAEQVAEALAAGIRAAGLDVDLCPVADGGEGTAEILRRTLGGVTREAKVSGPFGTERRARFALLDDLAFLDLAAASGIAGLGPDELDPIKATTTGTGELMLAAQAAGANRIFVAAGGSATVDAGAGALAAIEDGGGLGDASVTVLCDVDVPFERAAAVFGPQKGAGPSLVPRLERRMAEQAAMFPHDPRGLPMSGAAGGFSGAMWAVLGARLLAGGPYVLDRLDFEHRLRRARAVITGEGGLDEQSFMGKITGRVVARAAAADVPVHVVCGNSSLTPGQGASRGLASIHEAGTPAAMTAAARQIAEGG